MAAVTGRLGNQLANVCANIVFSYAPATNITKVCRLWRRQWQELEPFILKEQWQGLCKNARLLARYVKPATSEHLALFKQLKGALQKDVVKEDFDIVFKDLEGSLSFKDYLRFEIYLEGWRGFFAAWRDQRERCVELQMHFMRRSYSMNLSGFAWASAPPLLYKFENLIVLNLSNNHLYFPPPLKECALLTRLEYLDLRDNPMRKDLQLGFKREVEKAMPKLRQCDMNDCEFTTLSSVNLQRIWGRLSVQKQIEDRSNYNMFLWFAHIGKPDPLLEFEELDLSNLELTYLPREIFRFKNLKKLDLRKNSVGQSEVEVLEKDLPKLETCYLDSGTFIKGPGCVIC